ERRRHGQCGRRLGVRHDADPGRLERRRGHCAASPVRRLRTAAASSSATTAAATPASASASPPAAPSSAAPPPPTPSPPAAATAAATSTSTSTSTRGFLSGAERRRAIPCPSEGADPGCELLGRPDLVEAIALARTRDQAASEGRTGTTRRMESAARRRPLTNPSPGEHTARLGYNLARIVSIPQATSAPEGSSHPETTSSAQSAQRAVTICCSQRRRAAKALKSKRSGYSPSPTS